MEKRKERPQWWPKNPYPEDIFSMTIEGYKKAIPDPELRTAVSGFLGRIFWDIADNCIYDALVQQGILKENERAGGWASGASRSNPHKRGAEGPKTGRCVEALSACRKDSRK